MKKGDYCSPVLFSQKLSFRTSEWDDSRWRPSYVSVVNWIFMSVAWIQLIKLPKPLKSHVGMCTHRHGQTDIHTHMHA